MEEKEEKKPVKKTTAAKPAAKKPVAAKAPAAKTASAPKKAATVKKPAAKTAAKKTTAPKEETKPEAAAPETDDDEIISLVDDKGDTVNFFHVATIDYENEWYVFFQPVEKTAELDTDEVVVFKLDSDEQDNDVFLPVESEELLQKVYGEYVRIMKEHGDDDEGGCSPSACANCPSRCK
jgi:uncharacterized protein YrzB (UPF0473 family)